MIILGRMIVRGENALNASPKEQVVKYYESLRQKDSYGTQLWRALLLATKEASRNG